MNIFFQKITSLLKRHWLVIVAAILVGAIYIGPHMWFLVAESDVYQGIPLMQIDNEDFYLARMQEIIDGHPSLGSPVYFEYKDQFPIAPPTVEMLYAIPTILFGISLVTTLTASKFLLPSFLFLLVYILIYQLLGQENKFSTKLSALTGGLFVVLGYDLISLGHVFDIIGGVADPGRWLIWTRPVNPISGAIFLFSFLLLVWSVIRGTKYYKTAVAGAGLFLGLMFASYFFSWGIALSVLAVTGLFYLVKRNYTIVKSIILIFVLGLVVSAPYWYLTWQARQSQWYEESLLRYGMFYTHYPLINKVLVVALVVYLGSLMFRNFQDFSFKRLQHRDYLILAFLLGGLLAFNQQIVTGMTIWPFHFVQYTIPLSIVSVIVALHMYLHERRRIVWTGIMTAIILASLGFGLYTQYATYQNSLEQNRSTQSYAQVFDWFNHQEKECVVAVVGNQKQSKALNGMILAFTHCNIYGNNWVFSLMPEERIYHSLLTNLRLRGVTIEGFDEYMKENPSEMRTYLASNWAGLHENSTFPDFQDSELPKRIERFPSDYNDFLRKDFKSELDRFRLDYIVSFGPLPQPVIDQLGHLELQEVINGLYIYRH